MLTYFTVWSCIAGIADTPLVQALNQTRAVSTVYRAVSCNNSFELNCTIEALRPRVFKIPNKKKYTTTNTRYRRDYHSQKRYFVLRRKHYSTCKITKYITQECQLWRKTTTKTWSTNVPRTVSPRTGLTRHSDSSDNRRPGCERTCGIPKHPCCTRLYWCARRYTAAIPGRWYRCIHFR